MSTAAIITLCAVFMAHALSDFYLQREVDAKNKSKSLKHLSIHIAQYTLCMFVFLLPFGMVFGMANVALYTVINGAVHFVVDYFTSKQSAKAWATNDTGAFWAWIGTDQAFHAVTLITTFNILYGG